MEMVNVAIPTDLYVLIYQIYQEQTSKFIEETLRDGCNTGKSPGYAKPSYRPGDGTVTGRVWEIADEIKANKGSASREDVVQACLDEKINMNTASTQFSHWNKENREQLASFHKHISLEKEHKMDATSFVERVASISRRMGFRVETNRSNQTQIDFGHKKLHAGHLSQLYPAILEDQSSIAKLIESVAPGRPCTHRPMREIVEEIKKEDG